MEAVEAKSPKPSCQHEAGSEERPSSPINDCAICLEQLTDKSFTNSCFHMFCFHCLKAWSKVNCVNHGFLGVRIVKLVEMLDM